MQTLLEGGDAVVVGLPRRAARVEGSQLVEELVDLLFVHAVRGDCEPHLPALCMMPPPAIEDGEGCSYCQLLLARRLALLVVAERIGRASHEGSLLSRHAGHVPTCQGSVSVS